jgi:hypothetical protein
MWCLQIVVQGNTNPGKTARRMVSDGILDSPALDLPETVNGVDVLCMTEVSPHENPHAFTKRMNAPTVLRLHEFGVRKD